jgi:hypothetical protein
LIYKTNKAWAEEAIAPFIQTTTDFEEDGG